MTLEVDVVIIGAGTAGAAAAAFCAERGLATLCIDARPLDDAGARWVNGVPAWCFDEAGLARPAGAELRGSGHRFHILCGWGPSRLTLDDHGVMDVDMRHLVARLQERARRAGAAFRGQCRVRSLHGHTLETDAGELRARWFVDASGLAGAGLLSSARPGRSDLCAAAQEVRRVSDLPAAGAFFERHGVQQGDTLCFTSVAGGYSIVNARLEGDEISILTGSIPATGQPSGRELLDRFVADNPFIGEKLFGGARAIPLGRPRDRLLEGPVLALGDAAGQVFAAHGSGIGAGLLAARMLADALAEERPERYAVGWQRRYGGLFAAYDAFRRFSQSLDTSDLAELMASGLLDPASAQAGLEQRMPALGWLAMRDRVMAARRAPRQARRLLPALGRMLALLSLYRAYPHDPKRVAGWARLARRL